MEKLAKKECKFAACPFKKNSLECVTEHEKTCIYRSIKCKYFEKGCDFEAEIKAVEEHEIDCEQSLSEEFASELSFAGAAKEVKPKKNRARATKVQAKLMPDGLCWKHHKYGGGAHRCELPSECKWDDDFMLPSTSGTTFEHRESNALGAERSTCKFHGCSFSNKNPRRLKSHEMTQCPYRNLSLKDCHDAARDGNLDKIKNMIEYGGTKNPADKYGRTLMHVAAKKGHFEIVKLMLQYVEDKNPADKNGETPLHLAAQNEHFETVKLMLQYVEDKNPADKYGLTPLHLVVHSKCPIDGHFETVKLLLQYVEDKNPAAKGAGMVGPKGGVTPLHLAAQNGHFETVKLMLQYVEDKNPADKYGLTPLHLAAQNGRFETVKLILECVNNAFPKDYLDKTPLQYAIEENHTSVAQLFRSCDEKASVSE